MSFSNVSFILHKPQLSENIGACARGLKNFNFSKLILVNPKPLFPNDKIIATSVGAKDIIKNSKVYKNLDESIKKFDYIIATTARFRNKNIKHLTLNDLKKINFKKKIAFLFGSEASGLSNNEISYANFTLNISANSNFKSLNLSHSVIIICQIVFNLLNKSNIKFDKSKKISLANKKDIYDLVTLCISNLDKKDFFKPNEKKPIMIQNLRSIFYKMDLSKKEIRILSSVFASLGKKT
tara:strand:+ start:1069 stop:1782 length:714 start_codon:yes stop_codon:yes gene_type:complete